MTPRVPDPGDVLWLGRVASVQFAGDRAVTLAVTCVDHVDPYTGWAWLTGYELARAGTARTRRTVYVHLPGLRLLHPRRSGPPPARTPTRIPRQATPRTRTVTPEGRSHP